ncbi:MAG: hypothetical protein DMG13_07155 [Acidobacteria bacterium]|nr:MAG: hypothetical protein DMG13_07155 [Acidobacteriota bacterium]PYV30210.1 MAG: hypothetical protein DMG09_28035 [Acidobacteriota bacterium]
MRGNPTTVRRKYIEQNRYFTTGSRFDVVGTSFATTDPKSNTSTTTFSSADYYAFPQFVTNALGHQTEYAWWQHVISDLDGTVYYLRNGDLQSVRDPNGVLVSQLWYSDALGRRTQETTPAETRNFSYDDLNYLTTQASGSGYQYAETNPVGNLIQGEQSDPAGDNIVQTRGFDKLRFSALPRRLQWGFHNL